LKRFLLDSATDRQSRRLSAEEGKKKKKGEGNERPRRTELLLSGSSCSVKREKEREEEIGKKEPILYHVELETRIGRKGEN